MKQPRNGEHGEMGCGKGERSRTKRKGKHKTKVHNVHYWTIDFIILHTLQTQQTEESVNSVQQWRPSRQKDRKKKEWKKNSVAMFISILDIIFIGKRGKMIHHHDQHLCEDRTNKMWCVCVFSSFQFWCFCFVSLMCDFIFDSNAQNKWLLSLANRRKNNIFS